jgi:hypothetical protein
MSLKYEPSSEPWVLGPRDILCRPVSSHVLGLELREAFVKFLQLLVMILYFSKISCKMPPHFDSKKKQE